MDPRFRTIVTAGAARAASAACSLAFLAAAAAPAALAQSAAAGAAETKPTPAAAASVPAGTTAKLPADRRWPVIGRVLDAAGKPVVAATVALAPARGTSWPADAPLDPTPVETAADGRFTIVAPAGVYHLVALAKEHPVGYALGVRVGGAQATTLPPLRLPPAVALAGRVLDAAGAPVAGAAVAVLRSSDVPAIVPWPLREGSWRSTATGADGRFEVRGLTAGAEVALRVEADGQLPWQEPRTVGGPAPLEIRLAAAGALLVRVRAAGGGPIAGAEVRPARGWGGEIGGGVVEVQPTDERGEIRFDGLQPGEWQVYATAPRFRPEDGRAVVTADEVATLVVELEPVATTDVTVHVRGPDGESVAGAKVRLSTVRGDPHYHQQLTTPEEGRVLFAAVPAGAYWLFAEHPELVANRIRDQRIDLDTRELTLELAEPPGGRVPVAGRVTGPAGEPVAGAEVAISRPYPDARRFTTRAVADGTFVLAGVAPGRYGVDWSAPGWPPGHRGDLVVPAEGLEGLELAFARGGSITGELIGAGAAELALVRIHATQQETGRSASGWVDANGRYQVDGLGAGAWRVVAQLGGRQGAVEVRVDEGATVNVPLELPAGYSLRGVALLDGLPLAGAAVGAGPTDATRPGGHAIADAAGRFTIHGLAAGEYRLTVSVAGSGRLHHELVTLAGDEERTVHVRAGALVGQVTGPRGQPLEGMSLQMTLADSEHWTSHSHPSWANLDRDGRFSLRPLEAGSWALRATAPGYLPLERKVDVAAGATVEATLELEPTAGLRVRIETAAGGVPERVDLRLVEAGGEVAAREITSLAGDPTFFWSQAPPGSWRLKVASDAGGAVEAAAEVPGPEVHVVLPAVGAVAVALPDLPPWEAHRHRLVLLDEGGEPVASLDGRREWPVGARGGASGLPPGAYVARVTSDDGRTWSGPVAVEDGRTTAVLLGAEPGTADPE